MDDVTRVLLVALGGAAVAALAGLFGAWIQSRREHAKWVRERRYDAFTRFFGYIERLDTWAGVNADRPKELRSENPVDPLELQEAAGAISILGPDAMRDAGAELRLAVIAKLEAMGTPEYGDRDRRFRARREEFVVASRKLLQL